MDVLSKEDLEPRRHVGVDAESVVLIFDVVVDTLGTARSLSMSDNIYLARLNIPDIW
jgi:hypothetical protein